MSKVLEINSNPEESLVSLPIVTFPPFKLRAALVEKDPVVWVHLLEAYNMFMAHLIQHRELMRLNEKTWEQLCIFVRSFLSETSSEMGQLLSLGSNVDVTRNLEHLKRWVLKLVEIGGGAHKLQMNASTLWDFVRVYVETDANTVRKIISEGGKIDCTYMLHNHLEFLVGSGKFDRYDLKTFESLIDRKTTTRSSNQSVVAKNNAENSKVHTRISQRTKKYDSNKFIDKFVTVKWIEILEGLYNHGEGVHSKTCKQLMIVTLLNCSTQNISSLATQLGISNLPALKLYPLFGGVLWVGFTEKSHFKGLETRLPFLKASVINTNAQSSGELSTYDSRNKQSQHSVDIETVLQVQEMFPELPVSKIQQLCPRFDSAEAFIDALFENPTFVEDLEAKNTDFLKETMGLNEFKNKLNISKKKTSDRIYDRGVPDEVRNKTMAAALKLLYDPNEDERDDTYDDAERQQPGNGAADNNKETEKYNKTEEYLWGLLKTDAQLFAKTSRKSKSRKELKDKTKWSDEQIEGWARMIERSPARALRLEEKYMFQNPNRKPIIKEEEEEEEAEKDSTNMTPADKRKNKDKGRDKKNGTTNDAIQSESSNDSKRKNKTAKSGHNRRGQYSGSNSR
ncbi:hypothetical protein ACO0QE_003435 [Hanseniaspora vineae]